MVSAFLNPDSRCPISHWLPSRYLKSAVRLSPTLAALFTSYRESSRAVARRGWNPAAVVTYSWNLDNSLAPLCSSVSVIVRGDDKQDTMSA